MIIFRSIMLNNFLVIWFPSLWLVVFSQLRSSTETNKRSVEGLETKLVKIKAEWESSKLAHEATRAEFESYKVRLCLSIYIFVAKSLQLYLVRNLENGKGPRCFAFQVSLFHTANKKRKGKKEIKK